MSRGTQNALLLLVGLSTLLMVVKGSYLNYVKPSLLPWLIVAAVVLIGLAVVAVVRDVRGGGGDSVDGEGHRHNPWLLWLLLVPIALTVFVVPPPLGAGTATPEVVPSAQPKAWTFPPLPAERAPAVSISEILLRARNDSSSSLSGRLITTTGFTLKYDDGTYLARVVIICCAADARLARVHLSGPLVAEVTGYPEDTWLQVEGTVLPETATAATNYIPTMTVSSVKRIETPANTYTY